MKKLFVIALLMLIPLFSFQKTNHVADYQQPESLKHLQVKITGMTCEIGCARTIESKISKMPGVKFSKVNYSESIGQFSYDPKTTSSDKIIKKINGIAGGGIYKVVDSKEVKSFKN